MYFLLSWIIYVSFASEQIDNALLQAFIFIHDCFWQWHQHKKREFQERKKF
jgi:G:T-mismatch repair DNA endonuclease (very short patch repair protein)